MNTLRNSTPDEEKKPEIESGFFLCPIIDVVMALEEYARENKPEVQIKGTTDTEYISWIGDVIQEGLPTRMTVGALKDVERLQFDGYNDVDLRVAPHIEAIKSILRKSYEIQVNETISELNEFIVKRAGLLVVNLPGFPHLVAFKYYKNNDLELDTLQIITSDPSVYVSQGETELKVDISILTHTERWALDTYRKKYSV